jgi:hypothetical protein
VRANLAEVEPFRLPSGKSSESERPAAWTTKDVWMYEAHAIRCCPYDLGLHQHRLRAVHLAAA